MRRELWPPCALTHPSLPWGPRAWSSLQGSLAWPALALAAETPPSGGSLLQWKQDLQRPLGPRHGPCSDRIATPLLGAQAALRAAVVRPPLRTTLLTHNTRAHTSATSSVARDPQTDPNPPTRPGQPTVLALLPCPAQHHPNACPNACPRSRPSPCPRSRPSPYSAAPGGEKACRDSRHAWGPSHHHTSLHGVSRVS